MFEISFLVDTGADMSGTGLAQIGTNNWSSLQGQGCLGRVLGMYNSNSSVVLTAVVG